MDCTGPLEEFIATGRTGRRNAMPDILDEQKAAVGTGGLAFDMEKMNCSGIMLTLSRQTLYIQMRQYLDPQYLQIQQLLCLALN